MEPIVTGTIVSGIVAIAIWWIKSSITTLITTLTTAVNDNTKAINLLTADYRVQDEKLSTINHTLRNYDNVHKLIDANMDEFGKELNGVKTQVSVLIAKGSSNGHYKG